MMNADVEVCVILDASRHMQFTLGGINHQAVAQLALQLKFDSVRAQQRNQPIAQCLTVFTGQAEKIIE
ncbi:hypothetical protein D3C86_1922660 [compost metagenome]